MQLVLIEIRLKNTYKLFIYYLKNLLWGITYAAVQSQKTISAYL